jgi:CHAD domain-containing protein
MAYKFRADEPVSQAIVRCGREQLDRAVGELSERINEDPAKAVHNARKAIKKERALLRLARGAMPGEQRRHENAALRKAARRLSGARDADVMIGSVAALAARCAGQLPASTFDAVREHLESRRAAEVGGSNGSRLDARAVQDLGVVRARVDGWEIRADDWAAIDQGLRRSYRRGREALKRARQSRSLEDLHAWRKRAKDLWYHERLLAPAAGPGVRGQAKDAHRLADLLGDDHDLGVLRETLTREVAPVPVDVDAVVALIDHRRAELQDEALRLGQRVYAESPKAYRRRMRRAWRAGRAVARVPSERHPAELAAATREPQTA